MEREPAAPRETAEEGHVHEASSERQIIIPPEIPAAASTANGPGQPRVSWGTRASRRTMLRFFGAAAVLEIGSVLALSLRMTGCAAPAPKATSGRSSPTSTPTTPPDNERTDSEAPEGPGDVIGNTKTIPLNSAKTFGSFVTNGPGVLIHLPDDDFVAYSAVCTHQGCTVAYHAQSQHLECPCHGSVFDPANAGTVVTGPATQPLTAIKITIDKGTGTITQG